MFYIFVCLFVCPPVNHRMGTRQVLMIIYAGDGHEGYDSGYQCSMSKNLSSAELAPTKVTICGGEHGDLQPGDTIEVHWVYTSCDVQPGPTLGSCLSDACANPDLRVETQNPGQRAIVSDNSDNCSLTRFILRRTGNYFTAYDHAHDLFLKVSGFENNNQSRR